MSVIGAANTDYISRMGGPLAGPFYRYPYASEPDYPVLYTLTYETSGTSILYKVWKSDDMGHTWAEQDSAGRPSYNGPNAGAALADGPFGFGAVQDTTDIHVVMPHYLGTGSGPLNDIDLKYHTFDMTTDTWSSLVTTMPDTTAVHSDGGSRPSAFCIGLRSDGDLIVAYTLHDSPLADNWVRTWLRTWNGSTWSSAVSAGDGPAAKSSATVDANTLPQSIVVDDDDRAYLAGLVLDSGASAPWDVPYAFVAVYSSADSVTNSQFQISDLHSTDATSQIYGGAIGRGDFNATTGEVLFPVIHSLWDGSLSLAVGFGIRALTATKGNTPTWTDSGDLISQAEYQADEFLNVQENPDSSYGNGAAIFDGDGNPLVVWGDAAWEFSWSRRENGTWTAPAHLTTIPPAAIGDVGIARSLSAGRSTRKVVSVCGWANDSVGTGDWCFFADLPLPSAASASSTSVIGVSY